MVTTSRTTGSQVSAMVSTVTPRTEQITREVEAWHALSEHGGHPAAAAALGVTVSAVSHRTAQHRARHGLPGGAKPWDPSGVLVLICPRRDKAQADSCMDMLLEALELAQANGEADLAMHIRRHLHRLECRVYGRGLA
jgi:hypothetical protein